MLTASLWLLATGCDPNPEAPNSSSAAADESAQQATDASTVARRRQKCDGLLSGTLGSLGPESDPSIELLETELGDLEIWRKTCSNTVLDGGAAAVLEDPSQLADVLPENLRELATGEQYTRRDLRHLVDSLFAQAVVATSASRDAVPDDAAAAMAIFDLVAREVMLATTLGAELPVSQRRLWMLGLGSPSDQMWLTMTLARQRRIDAAVLQLPVREGLRYELLAVACGGDPSPDSVLLFDPQIGFGIPSIARPGEIATLAEGRADDAVFRAFDLAGRRYPVTSELLDRMTVAHAAEPSLLAPRMGLLQLALPPDREVELFESIGPSVVAETGLPDRLAAALDVPIERVRPWGHSVYRPAQSELSPNIQQLLLVRQQVLAGPLMVGLDKQNQLTIQPDPKSVGKGRAAHLTGRSREAAGLYLRPQVALVQEPKVSIPPQIAAQRNQVNELAAQDARYWSALLQLQQGQPESAARMLTDFVERTPQSEWARPAVVQIARIAADQGDLELAQRRLAIVPNPSFGELYLMRQWGAEVPTTDELQATLEKRAAEEQRKKAAETPAATGISNGEGITNGEMPEKSDKSDDQKPADGKSDGVKSNGEPAEPEPVVEETDASDESGDDEGGEVEAKDAAKNAAMDEAKDGTEDADSEVQP